jgi:hypothetical protein
MVYSGNQRSFIIINQITKTIYISYQKFVKLYKEFAFGNRLSSSHQYEHYLYPIQNYLFIDNDTTKHNKDISNQNNSPISLHIGYSFLNPLF